MTRTGELFPFAAPLVIIGLSLGAAACAVGSPYNPERLPATQTSRIGEICHRVMGLPAGHYADYQACVESLSHSVAVRRDTGPARGPVVDHAPPQADKVKSYYSVSNAEIHRRAQQACAEIGEAPATGASAQCVADLEGALFAAGHPLIGR